MCFIELTLPRASPSREIALSGSCCLRSTLAAAPVFFASALHCLKYFLSVCTVDYICDMIVVYHRSRLTADADPGNALIKKVFFVPVNAVYEIMLLRSCIADTRSPATRDSVAALEVCIRSVITVYRDTIRRVCSCLP
jgi:hypothetical protein